MLNEFHDMLILACGFSVILAYLILPSLMRKNTKRMCLEDFCLITVFTVCQ